MKKIAKRSVEVEVQPEDISPLELLQPGKLNKRTVMHLLRKVDVKKVGIAAGGAAVVLSAVSHAGRYAVYKGIVSSELKRQLSPLNKKLDELKAQNAELKCRRSSALAHSSVKTKKRGLSKKNIGIVAHPTMPFFMCRRASLLVRLVFQYISRLAVENIADGRQGGKADGADMSILHF